MTNPSDPENKPPTRIPRPEDILARPAVVVGSGTSAKRFNATMVGVAPPASPASPSGNAEGAPPAAGSDRQDLPKRPPPLRRPGGTMLGLSPPGVDPAAPWPPAEVTPRPAVAYRDANLPSQPLPEPVSLESDVMASPMPFSRDDIPVAAVTRSEVPPAFVTAERPGSEPEIGSVDLALQSVAAVESRVSSSSDELRAAQSEPVVTSEAAWAQQPHFVPSHQGLDQTFNLAAPMQAGATKGAEWTSRAAQPAPGNGGQAASTNTAAAGAWTPPKYEPVADARAVLPATPPRAEAPPEPDAKPAAPSSSGFGLVMGLVLGIAVVSAAALGAILVFAPEADLAQAVRDVFGMSRPGVKPPPTPAANADATQPITPASAPNDGVAAASGVPESDSPSDAVATAPLADEAPSTDGVASTGATTAAADAPLDEPPAGEPGDEAPDDAEETPTAPSAPVEQGFDGVPDSVDQGRLVYLVRLAIRRAEKCHLGGRAVGTANVVLTFGPNGRVSDARVVGAPIEGAPVAECIEGRTRAVSVKPYEGNPFTYTTKITLR